jgi:hypothetical protein
MKLVYSLQVKLLPYGVYIYIYMLRPRKDVPMLPPPPKFPSKCYTLPSSVVPYVPPLLSGSSLHTNVCTVGYCGLVDIGHRRLEGVTAVGRVAASLERRHSRNPWVAKKTLGGKLATLLIYRGQFQLMAGLENTQHYIQIFKI